MNVKLKLFGVIILFFVVGCSLTKTPVNNADDSFVSVTPANTVEGYPALEESIAHDAYPATTPSIDVESAYPIIPRIIDESKRFAFKRPIQSGQEQISGTGYPDTSIKVISVSQAGEVLGLAATDNDGVFSMSLSRPLEVGEVVGIQLGDDSLLSNFRDAPGTDIPMIGFLLDQEVVVP